MSFGLRDEDWVDPPEEPVYEGACRDCARFTECPCGCGWGFCADEPGGLIGGDEAGCEDGEPR